MGQGQRSYGSSSKVEVTRSKCDFRSHFTGDIQGHRSKVTWVKVKGQVGQAQPKGDVICRWAHVNVKLHFCLCPKMPILI